MTSTNAAPVPNPAAASLPAAVTLFGATGFTGQLIARALAREGIDFRIAGRSEVKLRALSAALPNRPAWIVADALKPATLAPLFQHTFLLINCAGPFTDNGERTVAQAAMNGVHYIDITNELGYVFRARTYHEMARRSGAAITPACAFEVALADCAARLVGAPLLEADPSIPLDSVDIVYALQGQGSSQGTRRSAVRSLATSWIAYRDGVWRGQAPGAASRRFELPGGQIPALSFPSSESVTVPLHLSTRRVDAWMTTTAAGGILGPVFVPFLARLSRSILRPLILRAAASGGLSPENAGAASSLTDSPFTITVEAARGDDKRALTLQGRDPYALTAEIVLYAAKHILTPGFSGAGFLAPSQLFNPHSFLAFAQEHWGIKLR
jgi:short subunit dehydrogenase-like uncharacterized protein